jgi:hypothetical protein
MADYDDKYTIDALTGKDVGVIFGIIHEGITPTGTVDGTNTKFVIDPDTYGPFYPHTSKPKDFVPTKSDVTVYDDGVAATITTFTPSTGEAELSAAPAEKSVMTADVVEQRELYIAQNATLTADQDTSELDQLRNPVKRKTYGNIEFTLKADFKIGDLETMKLIFDETATQGVYEYPTEPPTIYCAILIENTVGSTTTIEGIIYCEDARANFTDIINASAGSDAVENGFEITFSTRPTLVIVDEMA